MGDAIDLSIELGNSNVNANAVADMVVEANPHDAIDLSIELGNSNINANAVADMVVEANPHDATNLPRALVAGGIGESSAALYLALFRSPPPGLFLWNKLMFYAYYCVLVTAVLFGVAGAWVGLWVSHDPLRRRAFGTTVLWVSVLPLLFLAGIGGFAILKRQ